MGKDELYRQLSTSAYETSRGGTAELSHTEYLILLEELLRRVRTTWVDTDGPLSTQNGIHYLATIGFQAVVQLRAGTSEHATDVLEAERNYRGSLPMRPGQGPDLGAHLLRIEQELKRGKASALEDDMADVIEHIIRATALMIDYLELCSESASF